MESPVRGVVAIRQRWYCESKHHPVSPPLKPEPGAFGGALSANFYVWRVDVEEWLPVDFFGVLFQGAHNGPIVIREGAMLPHDVWEKMWTSITDDPDFI